MTKPSAFARRSLGLVVLAICLFSLAFAYVEAAVVVYLRALAEPIRERARPGTSSEEVFPLLTLDDLRTYAPEARRWLRIELGREAATLIMLAALGLVVARRPTPWLAAFALAFGVWDVAFYAWLRLFIGWPYSLWTWDILFLLPVPWSGPVLAPLIVSSCLIVGGLLGLYGEASYRPLRLTTLHWTFLIVAGVLTVVAFCWDWRNTAAGGMPNPFHWRLFGSAVVAGAIVYGHAIWRSSSDRRNAIV